MLHLYYMEKGNAAGGAAGWIHVADAVQRFYPLLTALLFILAATYDLLRSGKQRRSPLILTKRKHTTLVRCSWLVFTLFFSEALILLIRDILKHHDHPGLPANSTTVYVLGSCQIWLFLSVLLYEFQQPTWIAFFVSWVSTFFIDAVLAATLLSQHVKSDAWHIVPIILRLLRTAVAFLMVVYGMVAGRRVTIAESASPDETRSLLSSHSDGDSNIEENAPSPAPYGSVSRAESCGLVAEHEHNDESDDSGDEDEDDEDTKEIKELQQQRFTQQGGWVGYLRDFAIFLPYIFPYKDRFTQFWLLVITICVALERFFMIMTPMQLGFVTDSLSDTVVTGIVPWRAIMIWGLLKFPGNCLTEMVKHMAGDRVSQFAYAQLKSAAFAHVLSLSMDYHSIKSSAKLTKAIEQGTDLSSVVDNFFSAFPMLFDVVIAAIALTSAFDVYMGFIVLTASFLHVYAMLKTNTIVVPRERISSERTRVESEVLYDSVTNWQTVVYHNRAKFEQDRYANAVKNTVMSQRRYYDWISIGTAVQKFTLDAGLILAACLGAMRVATGAAPLSSFVFLVAYWEAIREPMDMISWTFRETSAHLINAEWLFQLLQNKPSVQDRPDARPLHITKGQVEFRDVAFAYDPSRPILKDISFVARSGQSIGIVGETGGGKSTTLKLLYRFYDVNKGAIVIDGQDIRDVTLHSLRDALGAVPQDPSVFDQTIYENIRYAHPDATMDDVIAACKAARIHDQIMSFPDKYNTRIGERGVRLSGGELQRVAIARVILRRSKIVILDEATSAVDSGTEAIVQEALRTLSEGRTVFTVAHRLSTIVNADLILVVDKGMIIERGTHMELLQMQGKYYRLWSAQTEGAVSESS